MENNGRTKQRILEVSAELFSQKGFAATRVDKIAEQAGVTKSLIYHYFPSKEAILDYLIKLFFEELSKTGMNFFQDAILTFVKDGRMKILSDRFEFATANDLKDYMEEVKAHTQALLNWFMNQRRLLRIILVESLSDRQHKGILMRYMSSIEKMQTDSYLTEMGSDGRKLFVADSAAVFNKFFFAILPYIDFAVYCDSYSEMTGQSMENLKSFFLGSLMTKISNGVQGNNILFHTTEIM